MRGRFRRSEGSAHQVTGISAGLLFSIVAVASVAAVVVTPQVSDVPLRTIFPILALPLAVFGALGVVEARRYLAGIVIAAVCIVLAVIDLHYGVAAAFVLVCPMGAAKLAGMAQERLFRPTLEAVERSGFASGREIGPRLAHVLFNIPGGVDTRDISVDERVVRHAIPWRGMVGTAALASPLMAVVWLVMALRWDFRYIDPDLVLCVFTVVLYIVSLVLPPAVLRSLKVGIRTGRGSVPLYDGLVGTALRTFVPLLVAVMITMALTFRDPDMFVNVLISVALLAMTVVAASVAYYSSVETSKASGLAASWRSGRPADIHAPLEEKDVPKFGDGVPGTPMRDPESCFTDQKY